MNFSFESSEIEYAEDFGVAFYVPQERLEDNLFQNKVDSKCFFSYLTQKCSTALSELLSTSQEERFEVTLSQKR